MIGRLASVQSGREGEGGWEREKLGGVRWWGGRNAG